jgi:hypothetical protein
MLTVFCPIVVASFGTPREYKHSILYFCAPGAMLCMVIAHNSPGSMPSWLTRIAPLIGHHKSSLQIHVQRYQQRLSSLAHLLPYVDPDNPQELVSHVGTLLQLYHLRLRVTPVPGEEQQGGDEE